MVARLTKISNTLSRYFRIAQVGSSVLVYVSYIRQPRLCSSAAKPCSLDILCSMNNFLETSHFYTPF